MRPRVLLIEDDPDIATGCAVALEVSGYKVIVVQNREDGVAAFEKSPPALVILDYWMDGMSASEFMAQLKRINPVPPVLVISAFPFTNEIADILCATAYLQKPFDAASLVAVVKGVTVH